MFVRSRGLGKPVCCVEGAASGQTCCDCQQEYQWKIVQKGVMNGCDCPKVVANGSLYVLSFSPIPVNFPVNVNE
jgi:hypothetical protein